MFNRGILENPNERKIVNFGTLENNSVLYVFSANPKDQFFGKVKRNVVYMEDLVAGNRVGLAWPLGPDGKTKIKRRGEQIVAKTFYTNVVSTNDYDEVRIENDGEFEEVFLAPYEQLIFVSKTETKTKFKDQNLSVLHRIYFKDGMLIEDLYSPKEQERWRDLFDSKLTDDEIYEILKSEFVDEKDDEICEILNRELVKEEEKAFCPSKRKPVEEEFCQ